MVYLLALLLICCSCSAPLPRTSHGDACDCSDLDDCDSCPRDEGLCRIFPRSPDEVDFNEWGHDPEGRSGTWFALGSFGNDPGVGMLKDVDTHAYSSVIIPYALELERTRRMKFEDSKIYQVDDGMGVRWVRLFLSTQNIMDLCEARALLVDIVEGLLERLNANSAVTSSFAHTPITASDLEIYISFASFFVEYDNPTYIAWVSLIDGEVMIIDGVIKDFRKDFWNHRVEPYHKSKDFVMISRKAEQELDKKYPTKKKRSGLLFNIN